MTQSVRLLLLASAWWLWACCALLDRAVADDSGGWNVEGFKDFSTDANDGSAAQSSDSGEDATGAEDATDVEDATGAEEEVASEEPEQKMRRLLAHLWAGVGMGTRRVNWPSALGPAKVDTGPYLAVELGTEVEVVMRDTASLGFRLAYQTSAGLALDEQRINAPPRHVRTRSHRGQTGLFALFKPSSAFYLRLLVGYGAQDLEPIVPDAQTPRYTVSGPLMGVGFEFRIASAWLRIEPQVEGVLQVGQALRELGVQRHGLAGGGSVSLAFEMTTRWSIEAAYTAFYARVSSTSTPFTDNMNFLTLRLRGKL